jgi:uncharacterized metal-binding protein
MPNVRAHDTITLLSGIALVPVSWFVSPDQSLETALIVSTAHVASGIMFSPDLDIAAANYHRWGSLRLIWWPYKEFVPHRSWISHALVIGPLLRLVYFLGVVGLLVWLLFTFTGNPVLWNELQRRAWWLIATHPVHTIAFLVGFITGGAAHSIPDWLSTGTKRTINAWMRF